MQAYNLPVPSSVRIDVFTALGEWVVTVQNGVQDAGFHVVEWDGCDARGDLMPEGWYVERFELGSYRHMRRITLVHDGALADD